MAIPFAVVNPAHSTTYYQCLKKHPHMSLPYDTLVAQLLAQHTNVDDEDAFFAELSEKYGPHVRSAKELFWVNLQPFLLSRGYRLRERYHPDWKPSWIAGPGQAAPRRDYLLAEDRLIMVCWSHIFRE
jgi:hypothetical protein